MEHRVRGFHSTCPSLGGLVRHQAQGRGGQEPQPSCEGWVFLISSSADVGERVRCQPSSWGPSVARGSRVQVLVREGSVGGRGQQDIRGRQQLVVWLSRGPGAGS